MPSVSPIAEQQRSQTLDIVRAVALFGVFLMNVEYFARPLQASERMIEPGLHGLNHALAWFEYVFMHGKFWTLFAMLFGMGFAVMLGRAEAQGRDFAVPLPAPHRCVDGDRAGPCRADLGRRYPP